MAERMFINTDREVSNTNRAVLVQIIKLILDWTSITTYFRPIISVPLPVALQVGNDL